MIPTVVIDASVWVSQWRPQDANHDASRQWIERYAAEGGHVIASSFLSIEVAAAISRRTGDSSLAKEAVRKLHSFDAMHFIPMDSALVQAAVDVATDLQLRAGDAIYVALAHQMNIPLVSWDKEQLQRASRLIATYTPENYVFPGDSEKSKEGHVQDRGL